MTTVNSPNLWGSGSQCIHCCTKLAMKYTDSMHIVVAKFSFLQRAQCSHCKRCISYSNFVRLSVRLSVCLSVLPSVTRWYCVKTTARSTVQFAPLDSKMCLVLSKPKIFPRDNPFPLKFWLQVTYPLLKAVSFDTFCLVVPQL